MKNNENLVLIGQRTVLVPYKKEHVLQYHEWMKSPFLQEMTASEPLSLEEEYEMQQSWHVDNEKCTFILLALPKTSPLTLCEMSVDDIKKNAVMIGDVNIFLNDPDDDQTFGEIEIMIAEDAYRRTGRGLEALKMMMGYAIVDLGLKTFHAKISLTNQPSIDLFTQKLGFYQVSLSTVFQETTLEWSTNTVDGLKNDDPDFEPYGSKATKDQRQAIETFQKSLLDDWKSFVRRGEWEQL
ncbi:GNAT domain-containing protein [Phycomyces nitens]|nr:GNAT domain-containing protein [Phycomyces nitens]